MSRVVRRSTGILAVLATIAAAAGIGLAVFTLDDATRPVDVTAGDTTSPDRLTVFATVERIDAAQGLVAVRVTAVPRGSLTTDDGDSPARDITLLSSGLNGLTVDLAADKAISAKNATVELDTGSIARYPFDRYAARFGFFAEAGGEAVPIELVTDTTDPFFVMSAGPTESDREPALSLSYTRTPATFIVVGIMFLVMWGLALSVAAAAMVIVRKRSGLVWPALGWMAATAFALAAFRNTAPGSPPFGSIFDYTAFLWAESIVACALVIVVVRGVTLEWVPRERTETP